MGQGAEGVVVLPLTHQAEGVGPSGACADVLYIGFRGSSLRAKRHLKIELRLKLQP